MASVLEIARIYEARFYEQRDMPKAVAAALRGDMDDDLPIEEISCAIDDLGVEIVMGIVNAVPLTDSALRHDFDIARCSRERTA